MFVTYWDIKIYLNVYVEHKQGVQETDEKTPFEFIHQIKCGLITLNISIFHVFGCNQNGNLYNINIIEIGTARVLFSF